MAEQKNDDQLLADWWSSWRQADYSWDGLAQKSWRGWSVTSDKRLVETQGAPDGSRTAKLQDYWRLDASGRLRSDEEMGWEIVRGDGRPSYHVAHLPLRHADGAQAKDGWSVAERKRLTELLSARMTVAPDAKPRTGTADHRAQLQGTIIPDFFGIRNPTELGFCATDAMFARGVWLTGKAFSTKVDFTRALFAKASNFDRTHFGADADFRAAIFLAPVEFVEAKFDGKVNFSKCVAQNIYFRQATFAADANFDESNFTGQVSFTSATFSGDVSFCKASFSDSSWFTATIFKGESDFTSATSDEFLGFDRAQFEARATFYSATLAGTAQFDGAQFKEAEFTNVKFNGFARFVKAKFSGKATFIWTTFAKIALFEPSRFEARVSFERATFSDVVSFCKSTFGGDADFGFAHFGRRARFEDVKFESGQENGRIEFMNAQFMELADFGGASFPDRCERFSGSFTGTRFGGVAFFRNAGAHWIAALDGAYLEKSLILDDPGEVAADREFHQIILPGTRKTGQADLARAVETQTKERAELAAATGAQPAPITKAERREWLHEAPQRRLRELVGGCRTAKVAMGRERDEALEQRYYRFQLIARRQQDSTPLAERVYSWLYGALADYGIGLWQPFAALFFCVLGFAGVYWAWNESLVGWPDEAWRLSLSRSVDQDAWDALLFSTHNTFRPLSVWSSEFSQTTGSDWVRNFLSVFDRPGEGGQRLAIRLLATLQSALSVVLFFLFALAVRRRFQIG